MVAMQHALCEGFANGDYGGRAPHSSPAFWYQVLNLSCVAARTLPAEAPCCAQTSDLVNSGRFLAGLQRKKLNVTSVQMVDLHIFGSSDRPHPIARARPCTGLEKRA